jgi:oligopeptide/dipeptide ABC transporter ATP-binding protein
MYLGRIVEMGSSQGVFEDPRHPYTRTLIDSIPEPGASQKKQRLIVKGEAPSAEEIPPGCRFQTRCPFKHEICEKEDPALKEVGPGHLVACHL